jgi:hypothetical protein
MQLDQTAGFALLIGQPRVEGKGARAYALTGTRIALGLQGRDIRLVKALGEGVATGTDWRLTADTIHLHLDRKKLQHAFAWGPKDSVRAHATSTLNTIQADSLALDLPDEVLTEARAFGHAYSTSRKDSTKTAQVNWIAGDSLTARWTQQPDSSGAAKTKLHQLVARGSARSFTHLEGAGGGGGRDSTKGEGPSLDYSRGAMIDIVLSQDKVDRVTVTGRADGVHLEPRPPAPDTTKKKAAADTSKKAAGR